MSVIASGGGLNAFVLLTAILLSCNDVAAKDCTNLYIIKNQTAFGSYNSVVAEVLIKTFDDADYKVSGILFNGDWGVMKVCSSSVSLKVRWLIDPASLQWSRRADDRAELHMELSGRRKAYVSISHDRSEITEEKGLAEMHSIERLADGRYKTAGWNFTDDRYYLICPGCEKLKLANDLRLHKIQ